MVQNRILFFIYLFFKKSRKKFLFLSVSSLCFHIDTSACPAAAACPVAVSLWQHCPHVVERKTTCTPEGGLGDHLSL